MPVILTSFTAMPVNNNVMLDWECANEINNDYFTIERSEDGAEFEEAGNVNGAGNANNTSYRFTDYSPYNGTSYYRLKQTDYDGNYGFSDVRTVILGEVVGEFNVFPNPSNGVINIGLETSVAEMIVVVYDIYGKETFSKVVLNESNGIYSAIDLTGKLAPGVYLVKAASDNNVFEKKLVIK